MSKALVLGGQTGLLGQALCSVLTSNGWQVQALGRNDCDIFDTKILEKHIDKSEPDVIFNTVAWTQVDAAEANREDADRVNRVFPLNLAHILKRKSGIWLGHFSTDFIFSGTDHHSWQEEDPPCPESIYGKTKLAGEKELLSHLPEQSCIIRTAWLFGPGRKNFVSTILNLCKDRDSLSIVDDQIGSPTYTLDLAQWAMDLAEARMNGIWHGVNSGMASWYELANEACRLIGMPCRIQPIPSSEYPQAAKRPTFSVLDNHKLANFLGRSPRPWLQALRDYIFSNFTSGRKE